MSGYATGKHAWGQCQRCGDRRKLLELLTDGQYPNLLVCPECRDMRHPTEKPFRADDNVALRRPAPDLDDDSPGDNGQDLHEAMGWTRQFGAEV